MLLAWLKSRKIYLFSLVLFMTSCLAIGLDKTFTDSLHASTIPMDFWLQAVTWLGDGRVLIPGCLLFSLAMYLTKQPRAKLPLLALLSFLISGAITQFLKMMIGRPRPYLSGDIRYLHTPLDILQGFTLNKDFSSFPSGHSTAIFSVAWFVASQLESRAARAGVILVACLVALSRVALWKHFVADTMAGAAIGIFTSQVIIEATQRMPVLNKEDTRATG